MEKSKEDDDDEVFFANNSRRRFNQHGNANERKSRRSYNRSSSRGRSSSREKRYSKERGHSKERRHSNEKNRYGDQKERRGILKSYRQDNAGTYSRYDEDIKFTYETDLEKAEESIYNVEEDAHKLVLDSGCTRTVSGRRAIDRILDSLSEEKKKYVKYYEDHRTFRFGNNITFPSREIVSIPLDLGKLKTKIYVNIIDANIPVLLGRPEMARLGFVVDLRRKILTLTDTNEVFQLQKNQ